ncbi:MAG: DUF3795 domain-containing protein [Candidatus Marinimicrobia bacterium]|nr:DUF3795 domain-containing protein [Candidatus Neomarinimicrobiota bacterium]
MKKHPSIGCCGIDCILCPRYYTDGPSACPGCGAPDFKEKHPSCGFVTCCVVKHGYETCADCPDYPCSRFDKERSGLDSFVTHRKVFENLDTIRDKGLKSFLKSQKIRSGILEALLKDFDDGRSKSYFCLTCALLPEGDIQALNDTLPAIPFHFEVKDKNKLVRSLIDLLARQRGIELTLRKK